MNIADLAGPGGMGALPCPWAPAFYYVTTRPRPIPCGPIYDPYCPSRAGVVGPRDMFGYPTCCCPGSNKCHTAAIVPVGDEPVSIVTSALGPYALIPQ